MYVRLDRTDGPGAGEGRGGPGETAVSDLAGGLPPRSVVAPIRQQAGSGAGTGTRLPFVTMSKLESMTLKFRWVDLALAGDECYFVSNHKL